MKQVPPEVIESIWKNKVCLKGGLKTPMGGDVSSLNVQLRKELDLYASLVNCFNLPSLPTRHENVDIVERTPRANTPGSSTRSSLASLRASSDHQVLLGANCQVRFRVCLFEQQEEGDCCAQSQHYEAS
ncbi:isocitrate dehydrogenase [NAD] regulatory subunit 1, mitochondrial-like [Pyrus x bretschneideri]|uniref:isocitrate dehydrogenase [NAD] regulatory subunit 1, mitochondrial-like n=1 Tax=Pyrus x bretschneideri TaxID=225117 RepID=UPI0008709A96|nr:isocitrate dehydrogenase [NAD] regulatory subunit 1, mitochondrial-like [Pyrus x bretschneideri]